MKKQHNMHEIVEMMAASWCMTECKNRYAGDCSHPHEDNKVRIRNALEIWVKRYSEMQILNYILIVDGAIKQMQRCTVILHTSSLFG